MQKKGNLWNKASFQSKLNTEYLIRFQQLKRNSKTKKIQYLAIYSDRIQYYTDPDFQTLHAELIFSFNLTVEWLYLGEIKEDQNKLPPLIGFKLKKGDISQSFYLQNEILLKDIQKILIQYLLQKNINQYYKLIRKIGKGGFGSVYLVQHRIEKKFYAAKVFLKQKFKTKSSQQSVKKEINILRTLKHQNILNLKEVFITDNSIYLISDYYSGQSLEAYLHSNEYTITKQQIHKFMKQLLEGIAYLHSKGIMHRDLKPANIIFKTSDCQELVIVDFGLAEYVATEEYLFPRAGTPGYVAPEVANNVAQLSNYSEVCDIFSLGCVLYLLITGKKLFQGQTHKVILEANKYCDIELICKNLEEQEINDLLIALLEKDPKQRMSAKDILQLNLFQNKKTIKLIEDEIIESTILSNTISPDSFDFFRKQENFEMSGERIPFDYVKEDPDEIEIAQLAKQLKQL